MLHNAHAMTTFRTTPQTIAPAVLATVSGGVARAAHKPKQVKRNEIPVVPGEDAFDAFPPPI